MHTKEPLGIEIEEYLLLKGDATSNIYRTAFRAFKQYYQDRYGKNKGFSDFLDRIFEELKKPRREQRRLAEIDIVGFIKHLKKTGKSNNTIRLYFTT